MKRLLCIVGKMDIGGAETFLMKIYRKIDKKEYQMDFAVAGEEKGFYDDEILSLGGKIHHITPKSNGFLKNFISIYKLVKSENYKFVLRVSQHSLSAMELFAAKIGGAKVRVFRSSNTNSCSNSVINRLLHKLFLFAPRLFANVRIAPSTEAAEFMFGKKCIKKQKALILPNAIDVNVYKINNCFRKEIRSEFSITTENVIGHIGRFNAQKNHLFLLKAFSELLRLDSNSVLLLVGGGELENKVKEYAKELGIDRKVIFAGIRSDVPKLLNGMDIFAFPSLYEGMPNVIIEAQAASLPCVISNTITKEVNISGMVKFLPIDNPRLWADTISHQIGKRGYDATEHFKTKRYTIEECVKTFVNLIFQRV